MRIDKENLVALAVGIPADAHLVIELSPDRVLRSVRCASDWELAGYFQSYRPSDRVPSLVLLLAHGSIPPDSYRLLDECLLEAILVVQRDADGVPATALLHRRGDEPPKAKRYPFFLMPETLPPPVPLKGGVLLLFNGARDRFFVRETMKLARDAGLPVAAMLMCRTERLTGGAVRDLAGRVGEREVSFDTVVFARDPGERAVSLFAELTGKRVLTREDLVISIFEKRADGHGGKLTAASSSVEREKVRRRERSHGLSRLTGGVLGARGPGETVKEERKRLFKRRERRIRDALDSERQRRDRQRRFRSRTAHPTVAIVGYTNAGKSTLFNALVGEKVVRAADELFSSIDPKIRLVSLFGRKLFLLDTVGFIEGMSRGVLDAFAPTFDEIVHAALVVHVVDPTEHEWREKKGTVDRLLDSCGVAAEAVWVLYSKRDLGAAMALPGDAGISSYAAGSRDDIRRVKRLLYERLFGERIS